MKKILVVIALAMMLVWGVGVTGANAGTIDFFVHDTATILNSGTVPPSCNPDGQVTVLLSQMSFYGYGLDYSIDGWSNYVSLIAPTGAMAINDTSFTLSTSTGATFPQLVSFRLTDSSGATYNQGSMTFSGASQCDPSLFTKITVDWDSLGTMDVVNTCEGLSQVPIPAAVWLFGSGLFGLIGIRRRMQK